MDHPESIVWNFVENSNSLQMINMLQVNWIKKGGV